MGPRLDVVCIGELNPDLILAGLSAPAPVVGTEQVFTSETLTLGSSTAITCVLLARLGLRTALGAKVGEDRYGRFCLETLIHEGVNTSGVRIVAGEATGVTVAVSYSGDRLLLTRYGTMATFSGIDIDTGLVTAGRHLHVGSFFLLARLQADLPELFRMAQVEGVSTSLDLGWDPSGRWDRAALAAVLPYVDVVLPNRAELAEVTGTHDEADGIRCLHAMGAREIGLKLGAAGGLSSTVEGVVRHPGFPVVPLDTTGAGDAFNAGYIFGRLAGWDARARLTLANACGALTATGLGGIGGLDDLNAALGFVRDNGEVLSGTFLSHPGATS